MFSQLLQKYLVYLCTDNNNLRQIVGKRGREVKKKIYKTTEEETDRLKALYLSGQVVGGVMSYLLRIGYLHGKLIEEASRSKSNSYSIEQNKKWDLPLSDQPPANQLLSEQPQSDQPLTDLSQRNRLQEILNLGLGVNSFV